MRTNTSINLQGEYIVYRNQILGKGATGEVYLGKKISYYRKVNKNSI